MAVNGDVVAEVELVGVGLLDEEVVLHLREGEGGVVADDGTQLSPGIILMLGGAHDGGILQSSLFTSRSQNQVSGKLRKLGFWN